MSAGGMNSRVSQAVLGWQRLRHQSGLAADQVSSCCCPPLFTGAPAALVQSQCRACNQSGVCLTSPRCRVGQPPFHHPLQAPYSTPGITYRHVWL